MIKIVYLNLIQRKLKTTNVPIWKISYVLTKITCCWTLMLNLMMMMMMMMGRKEEEDSFTTPAVSSLDIYPTSYIWCCNICHRVVIWLLIKIIFKNKLENIFEMDKNRIENIIIIWENIKLRLVYTRMTLALTVQYTLYWENVLILSLFARQSFIVNIVYK